MSGDRRAARVSRPASCFSISRATARRAGEHDALHARIGDQRRADLARAGQELQRIARDARLVQDAHGLGGDQRRLLGGLGDHRIARRERGRDLAGEDRERKIPRADADDEAERGRRAGRQRARRLGRVIAQEVDRLAHLRDRVGVGLAGLAHDEADRARSLRASRISAARRRHRGALRGRDRGEGGRGAIARRRARRRSRRRARDGRSRRRRSVGGIAAPARPARRRGAGRKGAPCASGACVQCHRRARRGGLRRKDRARASCVARARRGRAGAAILSCGAPIGWIARGDRDRIGDEVVDGTLASAMRLTNEVLAPFSSSRRTR